VTPGDLREELERGTLRSAYLLAGEETLLRDDALAAIRGVVLADGPSDFNFDRLDGDTAGPGALLDAVRTLPVMARRRLVVVREPEGARRSSRGVVEAIPEAIAGLDDASGVVLVVIASKVDGRARWVRAFAEPAVVVRCDPPRGAREVAAFVREEAARQGVRLQRGTAEALVERTGPQLLMLRQEIAKLSLLAGLGEPVTRAHVVSGTSDVAEERIWELTDAIGSGRTADALGVLARLVRSGAAPPLVLGALVSHFRKLLRLRGGGSVAGPPFVIRKLEGQAQRYTKGRLLSCLRAIHETDVALKGEGSLPPQLALERLVMGLSG
jgi:DNA polymerase-3 subunit delta